MHRRWHNGGAPFGEYWVQQSVPLGLLDGINVPLVSQYKAVEIESAKQFTLIKRRPSPGLSVQRMHSLRTPQSCSEVLWRGQRKIVLAKKSTQRPVIRWLASALAPRKWSKILSISLSMSCTRQFCQDPF